MAKKIKFALEMNGVKIRTMEELQENFDLDATVQYLLDGKLLTWLEDRFYEDEAEKVAELDKDSPQMKKELCEILGVEYEGDSGMDVDELERLNEKKWILKTLTDDEEIIANADKTALNQEDLADLLNAGEETIYLCGVNFNIPIRFSNKRYIGLLGIPKIKIKATNLNEINDKGIEFKNVILPWDSESNIISYAKEEYFHEKSQSIPLFLLKQLLGKHLELYIDGSVDDPDFVWWLHNNGNPRINIWEDTYFSDDVCEAKKICLNIICHNKYKENDILHMHINDKFSHGWALTKDSFCVGGKTDNTIIFYDNISDAEFGYSAKGDSLDITTTDGKKINISEDPDYSGYDSSQRRNIFEPFVYALPKLLLDIRDFFQASSPTISYE